MKSVGAPLFLLAILATLLSGGSGQTVVDVVITNSCLEETTVAGLETCREGMFLYIDSLRSIDIPMFIFNLSLADVCQTANPCFSGSDTPVTDLCTINNNKSSSEYAFLDCVCPQDNVRWKDELNTTIYRAGISCVDINECAAATDTCDPEGATCTNIQGNYTCECLYGYIDLNPSMPGEVCQLYSDECTLQVEPKCDENADCQNLERYVGCYDSTFVGEEEGAVLSYEDCLRICKSQNQDYAVVFGTNANCACTSNISFFTSSSGCQTCTEPAGTSNECGGPSKQSVYITGPGHDCTCRDGFKGDGFNCNDVNECDADPCPSNSHCTDLPNDFTCTCLEGFIQSSNGTCASPAETVECVGGQEAAFEKKEIWSEDCSAVYLVDCDYNGTNFEADGERFIVDVANLSPGSSCNSNGVIVNGLSPDYIKNNRAEFTANGGANLLNAKLSCTSNSMSVRFDRYVANQAGFYLDDLYLGGAEDLVGDYSNDPDCLGRRWYDEGAQYRFEVVGYGTECGTKHRASDTSSNIIIVENSVRGQIGSGGGTIDRTSDFSFGFYCSINQNTQTVTSGRIFVFDLGRRKRSASSQIQQRTARQVSASAFANIDGFKVGAALNIYNDESFQSDFDSTRELEAGKDRVYASISTIWLNSERFDMRLVRCWMSPSLESDRRYKDIIVNGCQLGQGAQEDVTYIEQLDNWVSIGFPASSFNGGMEDVMVHCFADLCDTENVANCNQRCNAIASPSDEKTITLDAHTLYLSAGPIKVTDTCGGSYRGGCEHFCSVSQENQPVCTCFEGFVVDPKDPTRCLLPTSGGNVTLPTPWYYYTLPIVGAVFLIVAVVLFMKSRQAGRSASYKFPDLDDSTDEGQRLGI
ncbi:unnamed protein product [Clavelina lepadiformis]|uniref:Uncharacterized protein n=1 Tax=Clavelina lepadiformis TaxID=159417 RepID=A0ABP0G595_CLALP